MALTYSEMVKIGTQAPGFSLPGVDGKTYSLTSFGESKALLVVFMCNHCPYVIATDDRINQLAKDYAPKGLAVVGINSNDVTTYPEDSFEKMKERSKLKKYVFPYLFDETQAVAKAYRAQCTPDPFLYENLGGGKFALRYCGRIDDQWKDPTQVKSRDLANAIEAVLAGRPVNVDQKPSMGCNIKWRSATAL